jgi:aminopeptidase-like protein
MNEKSKLLQGEVDGIAMYSLAKELFPICRSITGSGVRDSHSLIRKVLPSLVSHEIDSGEKCFDWTIPKEWNVKDAYIETLDGLKVVDFNNSNLHVVSYSHPINQVMTLSELDKHLHSRIDMPDAIPYVTSYYKENWGFCLSYNLRKTLREEKYRVVIDSSLNKGSLTYGELIIPGRIKDEILISTYTCHPSMANNEVSGMVVTSFLGKWIESQKNRKYTYRIIFVPETIGAIAYLSKNLAQLKKNVVAGFVITCVGDDRSYSYMPSRTGNSLADKAVLHAYEKVLKHKFNAYTFLERGSDERQYCHPNVDLPVCSAMRTKYGMYPEYHTSLDNMDLISPQGLYGGFEVNKIALEVLELNDVYVSTTIGEPWLASRNLRPPIVDGIKIQDRSKNISNLLAFCDGSLDLIDIANILKISVIELAVVAKELESIGLLRSILGKN